jgi:hypothetical protein
MTLPIASISPALSAKPCHFVNIIFCSVDGALDAFVAGRSVRRRT